MLNINYEAKMTSKNKDDLPSTCTVSIIVTEYQHSKYGHLFLVFLNLRGFSSSACLPCLLKDIFPDQHNGFLGFLIYKTRAMICGGQLCKDFLNLCLGSNKSMLINVGYFDLAIASSEINTGSWPVMITLARHSCHGSGDGVTWKRADLASPEVTWVE